MNIGIIDIGSNTLRLNVYFIEKKKFSQLFTKKYTAGLASYVEDGRLSKKGIDKLLRILKSLKDITDLVKLDALYVFATASLRKVSNCLEIIHQVKEEVGLEIELISEQEEARLGYMGIGAVYPKPQGVSCDIGGGSTEIVLFENGKEKQIINLNIGSLSLYTQYSQKILPNKKEIKSIRYDVRDKLSKVICTKTYDSIVGIGGTLRAAGNICSELWPEEVSAEQVSLAHLKELLHRIQNREKETIDMMLKVAPARIHTFTPGLCIFLEVAKFFHVKELIVCKYGIREGYLLHCLKDGPNE